LGAVSLSNEFSDSAKQAMVRFYLTYFGQDEQWVSSKTPFEMQEQEGMVFTGNDYENEFKQLKQYLKGEGRSVPTLYKQYSELCDDGGVTFCSFNVDSDFADCIDGFVLVDIEKMKPHKRQRYLQAQTPETKQSVS